MQTVGRRQLVRMLAGLLCGGGLAGCLGDGDTDDGSGDSGSDDDGTNDVPQRIRNHLQDAQLYDGEMTDRRGTSSVEVDVGAGAGNLAFDPPALRVGVGTRVVWVWTGRGGNHDVASTRESDMRFESERTRESGHEFEHTFEEPGIALYECRPHRAQGMLGAVEIVDTEEVGDGS